MKKWEYLTLTYHTHKGGPAWGHIPEPVSINYQPAHKTEKKGFMGGSEKILPEWASNIVTCLNYFGEQGWELVSTDSNRYVFKRPKPKEQIECTRKWRIIV